MNMQKLIDDLELLSDFLENWKDVTDPITSFGKISQSYCQDFFEYLPQIIENDNDKISFITIAWLITMNTQIEFKKQVSLDAGLKSIESSWANLLQFIKLTLNSINSPEDIEEDAEMLDYQYKLVLVSLTTLSLSYKDQEAFFAEQQAELSFRIDIPAEVYWDYQGAFHVLPQLIRKELFSKQAIAWFIRTYEQVKKCMELEDGYEEEIFADHPESNKAREYAKITLSHIDLKQLAKIN